MFKKSPAKPVHAPDEGGVPWATVDVSTNGLAKPVPAQIIIIYY
jgi:hypothetical protein